LAAFWLAEAASSAYNGRTSREQMDKMPLTDEEVARLRRREAEILTRIDRLKSTMNETKALDTLAFKAKLLKEAQDELYRVQDKLAGLSEE
jgi:5-bromo-4-chloroindolyl phosphate hydrolysis protein